MYPTTPNAFLHSLCSHVSSLDLAAPVEQFSRGNDFCLVEPCPTCLTRTSIPHNLAELIRRQLLQLLDCRNLGNGYVVIVLVVTAPVGRWRRVGQQRDQRRGDELQAVEAADVRVVELDSAAEVFEGEGEGGETGWVVGGGGGEVV